MEKESLQLLVKSPEWDLLVKFIKAQNIAREQLAQRRIKSMEEALDHNYEIGFVHGQRSAIMLPHYIIASRDETVQDLIIGDRENVDTT